MYFTGFKGSKKAYLGINILETNKQIEDILLLKDEYIGGYKGKDGVVVLENIFALPEDGYTKSKLLFTSVCKDEESIYKCNVISKVKIGSLRDSKYLIATIYDLMCSLTEPMQGFTIERDYEDTYYLLICNQGEYIMNPNYNKENQDV